MKPPTGGFFYLYKDIKNIYNYNNVYNLVNNFIDMIVF
jgi:hypothetical protein